MLHPLLPSQVEALYHQLIRQPKQETLWPYLVEEAGEDAPPPPPQSGRGSLSSADQAAQAGDPMSYLVEEAGEGAPPPPPQPGRDSQSSADQAAQAGDPMSIPGGGGRRRSSTPSSPAR
jgi:hypothetical protein